MRFEDVTKESGLTQPNAPSLSYGGALLADLNGDGWLDLILLHHDDAPAELYFAVVPPSLRNGATVSFANVNRIRYVRAGWKKRGDIHGATAFRYSPARRGLSLVVHRGGSWGLKLNTPYFYHVVGGDSPAVVLESPRIPLSAAGRGRTALALSLRGNPVSWRSRPDLILMNSHLLDRAPHQRALSLANGGRTVVQKLRGPFAAKSNEFANVVDVDGDGKVEIIAFQDLHMYKVIRDFTLRDITANVLPPRRAYIKYRRLSVSSYLSSHKWHGVTAVAELDFDNDGQWDLYIARTTGQNLHWYPRPLITDDVLLRNIGGRFADVSVAAGITPAMDGYSRGVTTGDFDNDGWVDIIVSRYIGPDLFLRNRGDGTFAPPVPAGFGPRPNGAAGDMVTAADLDMDGRLDVVVSEGTWYNTTRSRSWGRQAGQGMYRVMRNVSNRKRVGNYILVRVGNSPSGSVTGLHAVVQLSFGAEGRGKKGMVMMRRVGNPGAATTVSFIECVHFGVGGRTKVARMSVRWTNGEVKTVREVAVNRVYVMGGLSA